MDSVAFVLQRVTVEITLLQKPVQNDRKEDYYGKQKMVL